MKRRDGSILFFDLRSKTDADEVETELKSNLSEFLKKANQLQVKKETKTDFESSETVSDPKKGIRGLKFYSQKGSERVTESGLPDSVEFDPSDILDPVEALRSVLQKKLGKHSLFSLTKSPSCIIIDEAQALKHLGETRVHNLIDSFVTLGRNENLPVVLVTSDYSAIEAFVGNNLYSIFLSMC